MLENKVIDTVNACQPTLKFLIFSEDNQFIVKSKEVPNVSWINLLFLDKLTCCWPGILIVYLSIEEHPFFHWVTAALLQIA